MKTLKQSALALALGLAAALPAWAATAEVMVASNGAVQVNPAPLALDPSDGQARFMLRTSGYVITSAAIPGFSCSVARDMRSATCLRTARAAKGDLNVSIGIKSTSGQPLIEPNIWVQNN